MNVGGIEKDSPLDPSKRVITLEDHHCPTGFGEVTFAPMRDGNFHFGRYCDAFEIEHELITDNEGNRSTVITFCFKSKEVNNVVIDAYKDSLVVAKILNPGSYDLLDRLNISMISQELRHPWSKHYVDIGIVKQISKDIFEKYNILTWCKGFRFDGKYLRLVLNIASDLVTHLREKGVNGLIHEDKVDRVKFSKGQFQDMLRYNAVTYLWSEKLIHELPINFVFKDCPESVSELICRLGHEDVILARRHPKDSFFTLELKNIPWTSDLHITKEYDLIDLFEFIKGLPEPIRL